MSLFDGKTIEADYIQLVRDNLAKLERDALDRQRERESRTYSYYQVVDGVLRYFTETKLDNGPIRRESNKSKDSAYRKSLASAGSFELKRKLENKLAGK